MQKIDFKLRASKIHSVLLGCVMLASFIVTIALPWHAFFKSTACLILFLYSGYIFKRYVFLAHPLSIRSLCHDGVFWQLAADQEIFQGNLQGDSVLTAWVSVLRFKIENTKKIMVCVLFRDSLAPDFYRKLMVFIRMG